MNIHSDIINELETIPGVNSTDIEQLQNLDANMDISRNNWHQNMTDQMRDCLSVNFFQRFNPWGHCSELKSEMEEVSAEGLRLNEEFNDLVGNIINSPDIRDNPDLEEDDRDRLDDLDIIQNIREEDQRANEQRFEEYLLEPYHSNWQCLGKTWFGFSFVVTYFLYKSSFSSS